MEHVIHSSMPIDFERRYAMDNLIAQDADLIEIFPNDLVRRLRSTVCQGNLGCHRLVDDDEAADLIEALTAENERLNKSAECLAESRRLAVKDLAALEGHMRLEIGQWRVDYDCAIRDVEHLRERIEAQAAEIERLREALEYYAQELMTGPWGIDSLDFGDVARAALEQSK